MHMRFTKQRILVIKSLLSLSFMMLTACKYESQIKDLDTSQLPNTENTTLEGEQLPSIPNIDLGISDSDLDGLDERVGQIQMLSGDLDSLIPAHINLLKFKDFKSFIEVTLTGKLNEILGIENEVFDKINTYKELIENFDIENHHEVQKIKDRITEVEDRLLLIKDFTSGIKNQLADKLDDLIAKIDNKISDLDPTEILDLYFIEKLYEFRGKVVNYQNRLRNQ